MDANEIHIHDKKFKLLFSQQQIDELVKQLAEKLNRHYEKKHPLLIPVLNGSFIFAADLCRNLNFFHEISFIKVSSYIGTASTGTLQEKIGLSENITGKD
ncbi:MAG: phosphoribosyltransferase family protein, partial [Chitinophagales bacterium]|nr:phosphoribosyltransferase family protein [Chitinophagales bacterium]